jgi:hypothetical protein
LKIHRRQFLAGGAAIGALGPVVSRLAFAAPAANRKMIVVLARGAWDVTYVFDPRSPGDANVDGPWRREQGGEIDYDDESIGSIGDLTIAYNDNADTGRPEVSDFFATWADLCLVVNGIASGSIVHDVARPRILTGSRRSGDPDLAAIFGYANQGDAPIGYMDFAGQGFVGELSSAAARVGSRGQLELLLNDDITGIPGPNGTNWTYPLFTPDSTDDAAIQAWLSARESRMRDQWDLGGTSSAMLDDYALSRSAAADLRASGDDISDLIELGQPLTIQAQIDLAVDLLTSDLCQSVLVDTDLPWDTHTDNTDQNSNFNNLFAGLSYLADRLGRSALEQQIMVVVLSEFTRTPRLNAENGKDHWPVASALLFGAGVDGGRTIGQTGETLGAEPVNLSTGQADSDGVVPDYGNLIAGILEAAGVTSADYLPDAAPYTAIGGG